MEADQIQAKINKLYVDQFRNYAGNLNLSVPHIPRVTSEYLESRTIVLGQETNTWYKQTNDDLKEVFLKGIADVSTVCLRERYDLFVQQVAQTYPGKFWEFSRLLYDYQILKRNDASPARLSHCWMNLFVVEACATKDDPNGRPTKNWDLARKITELQGDLLYKVFEVLEPKLMICVTGHSLDSFLFENALCLTQAEIQLRAVDSAVLDADMLAEVVVTNEHHPLASTRIVRCYHPTYFMGYINARKKMTERMVACGKNESNSGYYQGILFGKLQEYVS